MCVCVFLILKGAAEKDVDEHVQSTRRSFVGLPKRAAQATAAQKAGGQGRAGRGGVRVLPQHTQVHGRSSVDAQENGQRAHRQHIRAAA